MIRAIATGVGVGLAALTAAPCAAQNARPRVPVVVELFTSEGCSSCPPADALLARVGAEQPVPGVEVIPLEEHVDYWDQLGWRDPFSSASFTRRQSEYDARVFRSGDIYTPQLVVDGIRQCVANDGAAVRRAIVDSAADAEARLDLQIGATADEAAVVIGSDRLPRHRAADLIVALTESGLATPVRGGENRGRTVAHGAVVRSMTIVTTLGAGDDSVRASAKFHLAPGWERDRLRVVAFLQERSTRRILGATAAGLEP